MDGIITREAFEKEFLKDSKFVVVEEKEMFNRNFYDEEDLPKQYTIKKTVYRCQEEVKRYWDVLWIDIYKDGKPYMGFGRDYSSLSEDQMLYVKQKGSDGIEREFLITTSQYMFTTIINLTDKIMRSYCIGNADKGWGYCPVGFKYSDITFDGSDNKLGIYGCYWGGPFGTYFLKNLDLANDLTDKFVEKDLEYKPEDYDDYDEDDEDEIEEDEE